MKALGYKPHIVRAQVMDGQWLWAVHFCGYHAYVAQPLPPTPDYFCTQLSVVKDIQRGREELFLL